MPYSTYRPEFMGSATLEPEGEFDAGSWQSFTLVYEAGRFGIDDTGSIKIGMRFATDFGPVQFDDPAAPGYTTIEASNGAELDYRWEFKRNIRPWSRSLYIGVKKHFLSEGDKITIPRVCDYRLTVRPNLNSAFLPIRSRLMITLPFLKVPKSKLFQAIR